MCLMLSLLSVFCLQGTVKVWDPRQKDSPVANMEPGEGEAKRDCWTVAFGTYERNASIMVTHGFPCCVAPVTSLTCAHLKSALGCRINRSHVVLRLQNLAKHRS